MLTEDSNLFSMKQHREPLSQTGCYLFLLRVVCSGDHPINVLWVGGCTLTHSPRVSHDVLLPLSTQGVRINTQGKGVMVRTDKLTKHGG